jgi:hypothetical protein
MSAHVCRETQDASIPIAAIGECCVLASDHLIEVEPVLAVSAQGSSGEKYCRRRCRRTAHEAERLDQCSSTLGLHLLSPLKAIRKIPRMAGRPIQIR